MYVLWHFLSILIVNTLIVFLFTSNVYTRYSNAYFIFYLFIYYLCVRLYL